MFAHPGKKLLFMGCEFGQEGEWNHDASLDWHLLEQSRHRGIQHLIRDLNNLYRSLPALHELDCDPGGFEWVVGDDANQNVFAWLRKGMDARDQCLVVINFSPNVYRHYSIRVPYPGRWREAFNSDSAYYGGANTGNAGLIEASESLIPYLDLTLPALGAIFLVPETP
jgi:1,4-alpha-glucan branching enzyme